MTRTLYIIKHGERMDFTLNTHNESWLTKAFDQNGVYQRFNLNMPRQMHPRSDGHQNYFLDPPLTKIGLFQARLTGKAMRDADISISHVYCSPALRCVQTCSSILKGFEQTQLQIHIEPGLFEWGQWFVAHNEKFPAWIKSEELQSFGYRIEPSDRAIMSVDELNVHETLQDFYIRSEAVVQQILDKHKSEGGNILIVGHGASLETCSRQLCDEPIPAEHDFYRILWGTSYCACLKVSEDLLRHVWTKDMSPILPLSHTHNWIYNPQIHYC